MIGIAIALADRLVPDARPDAARQDRHALRRPADLLGADLRAGHDGRHLQRRRASAPSPGDMRDGAPIHGNTRLEVIWVTIPFLMVTALAIYGWIVLDDIEAKQPNEIGERDRPAVHLVVRLPAARRSSRPSWCCRRTGRSSSGSTPRTCSTRSGSPSSGSSRTRCPGLTTQDPPHARPDRPLPGGLRRAVRDRPLHDAPERATWSRGRRSTPGSTSRSRPPAAARRPAGGGGGGAKADGAAVFAANGCGSCHTLEAGERDRHGRPRPRQDPTSRPPPSSSSRSWIPTRSSRRASSRTSCPRTSATSSHLTNSTLSWSTF